MRIRIVLAAVLGLSHAFYAGGAAAAAPPNLRAQVETELRTNENLKIPANVDRACVVDRALIEYPKVAKKVDFMLRLRLGKKLPPDADDSIGRMKTMLAAIAAIGLCTPKPAK